MAQLSSAHRRLQAKCQLVKNCFIKPANFLVCHIINILLTLSGVYERIFSDLLDIDLTKKLFFLRSTPDPRCVNLNSQPSTKPTPLKSHKVGLRLAIAKNCRS